MKRDKCAGGIVIGDGGNIAMVRHENGQAWLFPKGRLDPGEEDEEAARREVTEEAGVHDLELIADLGSYERPRMGNDGEDYPDHIKDIHMYLFAAPSRTELTPSMEIAEAKWVPYREVANVIGNAKDRAWFATVFDRVREAIQRD